MARSRRQVGTSTAIAARAEKAFPILVVQELEAIETEMGGRNALVGMLSLAPLTPDLRYLLGLLGDPQNAAASLAQICAIGNVLPGELLKQLASAALLRGKMLASQHIGRGIAAVAADVMRRAAPYTAPCNGPCQGTGYLTADPTPQNPNPNPVECAVCRGQGKLTYAPDLETQKLAIEMAQLLPKGGGINIANINGTGGTPAAGGGADLLGQLSKLTDKMLYGPGADQTLEAEVVEEGGEAEDDAPADAPAGEGD